MDVLRATGDEKLARQLWGDNCEWVEDRQQFMPAAAKPEEVEETPAARRRRLAGRKPKSEE